MLTEAQRVLLKDALEAKRRELARDIRSQTVELAISEGIHDPVDQVCNMAYRDEAVEKVGRLSKALASVENSLRALSDGSYGYCAECGEPIAARRLQVIPWATRCVRCQARLESDHHLGLGLSPSGEGREAA